MATDSEQQDTGGTIGSNEQGADVSRAIARSPTRSDTSSDSEGKPVREKLQETRIDTKKISGTISPSDRSIKDIQNGSTIARSQSNSGSESEREGLCRKRSREDFEEQDEASKHPSEKAKVPYDRHARKRSRDITKNLEGDIPTKAKSRITTRIEEADVEMISPQKNSSKNTTHDQHVSAVASPKNKRTRDQVEKEGGNADSLSQDVDTNGKASGEKDEERDPKRIRDKDEVEASSDAKMPATKVSSGSSFANISSSSPLAAITRDRQAAKSMNASEPLPQTSDEKFKSSGFGSFASSTASPFGGFGSNGNTSSPFSGISGNKLSSFAGSSAPSTSSGGGFLALASSNTSAFGGSSFGGPAGGGFASLGVSKTGLTSFGTPGNLEITGLKSKGAKPFGAAGEDVSSDDEEDSDSDPEKEKSDEGRRSSHPVPSQQPQETGEERETTAWTGRAKLYTMTGEPDARAWKERGTGPFKLNVTLEDPKKARFVLRADGTHRLLLNAAVSKNMVFGQDKDGTQPKDGRLVFNEPVGEGKVEMHLLKLKAENAVKLWEEVRNLQESEL